MNVEEACKIALENTGDRYVLSIHKHKEGYVIATSITYYLPDNSPLIVKENGEIDVYFPPDHFGEEYEDIEIPEKYRYKESEDDEC